MAGVTNNNTPPTANTNRDQNELIQQKSARAFAFYQNNLELADPLQLQVNRQQTLGSSSLRSALQYARTTQLSLTLQQQLAVLDPSQFRITVNPSVYPPPSGPTAPLYRDLLPTDVAPIQLWFDGNDPNGTGIAPGDGSGLSTWVNKGLTPVSITTTGTPTYEANFAGGKGSVKFPGSASFRDNTTPFVLQNKTFYLVGSVYNSSTSTQGFVGFTPSGSMYSSQNGIAYQSGEGAFGNKFGFLQAFGNGGYYVSYLSPYGATPLAIYEDTCATRACVIYVNGAVLSNQTLSYTPGDATGFLIGRRTAGGQEFLSGNICEIIGLSNNTLGTVDRQKIEGYLAWKWGLQGSLPADHPYKAAKPQVVV
jgi:hypothetical protein